MKSLPILKEATPLRLGDLNMRACVCQHHRPPRTVNCLLVEVNEIISVLLAVDKAQDLSKAVACRAKELACCLGDV